MRTNLTQGRSRLVGGFTITGKVIRPVQGPYGDGSASLLPVRNRDKGSVRVVRIQVRFWRRLRTSTSTAGWSTGGVRRASPARFEDPTCDARRVPIYFGGSSAGKPKTHPTPWQLTVTLMSNLQSPPSERLLKVLLRLIGTSSLAALVFVVAPHAWMISIHSWLGMGQLPDSPVVWYLARSTSAFYALTGGVLWITSLDPCRYRALLIYLGAAISLLGIALLVIDWWERMPMFWRLWEGPFLILFGLTVLLLSRAARIGSSPGDCSWP